ncbi:uncharacterized protein LOC143855441 [Tasmannia lanceolata]|uniref:uncharacterized protein LOC143855441 n=1 Tax=Tasmannia lanceolata TaxID=3420 RepID=UPI0040642479
MGKCYTLGLMSNVLQQQHVRMASFMDIMHKLREMFGQKNRSARQIAIKGLASTKMVEGTSVRDHMLKMMGYLNELEVLWAMLDGESQVDMVLASPRPSFNDFVMNYHMNKLSMTLTELLNHLQSTEDLQKKNKKSSFLVEANLVSTPKPKAREKERVKARVLRKIFPKSRRSQPTPMILASIVERLTKGELYLQVGMNATVAIQAMGDHY